MKIMSNNGNSLSSSSSVSSSSSSPQPGESASSSLSTSLASLSENCLYEQQSTVELIKSLSSEKAKKKINSIINEVNQLSDIEKLLLYLQLPNGSALDNLDPLKQKGTGNPLGKKAEIESSQTLTWIRSHLEVDPDLSLQKQEVYDEYRRFADANKFEPLCVADFGKAMKNIFPTVKPRRLGQRGFSKYCYAGLNFKANVQSPNLPLLSEKADSNTGFDSENEIIFKWAEKIIGKQFDTIKDLRKYLIDNNCVDAFSSDHRNNNDNNYKNNSLNLISINTDENDLNCVSTNKLSASKNFRRDTQKKVICNSNNNNNNNNSVMNIQNNNKEHVLKKRSEISTTTTAAATANNNNNKLSVKRNNRKCLPKIILYKDEDVKIKEEPILETDSLSKCSNHANETHLRKSPITKSSSTASILVVPYSSNENNITQTISVLTPSSPSAKISKTISATTSKSASKYKRIQPKPASLNCSNSNSHSDRKSISNISLKNSKIDLIAATTSSSLSSVTSNSSLDSNDSVDLNDSMKKDHSLVIPVNYELNEISAINLFNNSTIVNTTEQFTEKNSKRHIEESDKLASKKRIIGDNNYLKCLEQKTNGNFDDFEEDGKIEANIDMSQLRKLLEKNIPQNRNPLQRQHPVQYALKDDDEQPEITLQGFSELKRNLHHDCLSDKNSNNVELPITCVVDMKASMSSNNVHNVNVNSASDLNGNANLFKCTNGAFVSVTNKVANLSPPSVDDSHFKIENYSRINKSHLTSSLVTNVQNQTTSVPASPNSIRHSLHFMPISSRNTPVIFDNSVPLSSTNSSLNCSANNNLLSSVSLVTQTISDQNNAFKLSSTSYVNNMPSVTFIPSTSPSAANSPFVSPRDTPIPRSRNDSGQSTYSANSRQTPYPNGDSGISSISNSPFISPQSTPVPASRNRVGSNSGGGGASNGGVCVNSNIQRTLRARHSSGPGNPFSLPHNSTAIGPRSSSLSPMTSVGLASNSVSKLLVNENVNLNNSNNRQILPSINFFHKRNFHLQEKINQVVQEKGTICLTPDFSQPSSLSSNMTFDEGNTNFSLKAGDRSGTCMPIHERHRHLSSPYSRASASGVVTAKNNFNIFNCESLEIQNLLKNGSSNLDILSLNQQSKLLNRSHSVPVNQRISSKSYPTTPSCEQSFDFDDANTFNSSISAPVIENLNSLNKYLQSENDNDDDNENDVMVSQMYETLMYDAFNNNEAELETENVNDDNDITVVVNNETMRDAGDLTPANGDDDQTLTTINQHLSNIHNTAASAAIDDDLQTEFSATPLSDFDNDNDIVNLIKEMEASKSDVI